MVVQHEEILLYFTIIEAAIRIPVFAVEKYLWHFMKIGELLLLFCLLTDTARFGSKEVADG